MATEAGEGEIGDGQRGSTGKRWTLTGKRTPNWAGADIVERSPHPYGSRAYCEAQREERRERLRLERLGHDPQPEPGTQPYYENMFSREKAQHEDFERVQFWDERKNMLRAEREANVPLSQQRVDGPVRAGEYQALPNHPTFYIKELLDRQSVHVAARRAAEARKADAQARSKKLIFAFMSMVESIWSSVVDGSVSRRSVVRTLTLCTAGVREAHPFLEDVFLRLYYSEGIASKPALATPLTEDSWFISKSEAVDGVLWQTQADLKQLGREHRADSPEGRQRRLRQAESVAAKVEIESQIQMSGFPNWRETLINVLSSVIARINEEALSQLCALEKSPPGVDLVCASVSCLANGKLAGNKTWKHCKKILRANLPAVMAAVDPATIPEQVIAEVRVFLRDPRCSIGVLGRACEPCVPLAEWARQCLTIHRICTEYGQEKTEPQAAFQYVLQCVKQEHEEKMRPAVEDVNAALDALGAAEVTNLLSLEKVSPDMIRLSQAVCAILDKEVRSPDGAWDELRRVLQKDVFDVFLRYYQKLESDDAAVPLLGMAVHLSDADLGARLEEESAEAACLLGCVQAFYVYGEAREHYSSLRTLLAALRRAQAQYTQQIEDAERRELEERRRAEAPPTPTPAVPAVEPEVPKKQKEPEKKEKKKGGFFSRGNR